MVNEIEWLLAVEGGVAVALALALLVRALNNPSRWILAALLLDYGVVALLTSVPALLTQATLATSFHVPLWLAKIALISLNLAFATVYPHWTLSPGRLSLLVVSFVPAGLLATLVLTNPALLPNAGAAPNGFVQLVEILIVASYLPALWAFGRSWLKESGEFRGQFLYVVVAYLLWNLSFALDRFVTSFRNPDTFGPLLLSLGFTLLLVQVISILVIAVGGLVRAVGRRPDRGPDARFVAWFFVLAPFMFFQFAGDLGPLAFQGVLIPLLFYGGAKYQLVGLPLHLKHGIRGSVLGGIGLAIVFLVEESLQFVLGQTFGYLGGVAVAAGVVVVFAPVRRLAKKISDQAMPNVSSTPAYLATRRLELYRVALDGMIRDQVVDPKEAAALAGLRQELGITMNEHDTIEQMLRGARKRRRAVLAAAPA